MDILVGTSAGVFLGGSGAPAEGLSERGIRHLSLIGSDLFAGAAGGVYRSADGGRSWRLAGVEGVEVWDILPAPNDPRSIYAGTQPAHLYESADGGGSWREVTSFLEIPGADRWCVPNSPAGARARTLAFDAKDPERVRVGVEVGGVAASDDGGSSWSVTLPGGNPDIHVMVSHPTRAGMIFATTGYGRIDQSEPQAQRIAGLFGSEDGGATWAYLWQGIQPAYTRPICIDPRAPHALTVACAPTAFSSQKDPDGAQAMLYRSDDDGKTWRSLGDTAHSPSRANFLSVTPDSQQAGWVLIGTESGEVWRVSPAAEWTLMSDGFAAVQALLAVS